MYRSTCFGLAMAGLLGATCALAQSVDQPELSGSWYNPDQNGHGFNIEVQPNGTLVVYWYTYRPDGSSTFLLGVLSPGDAGFSGDLLQTNGMMFGSFDPNDNVIAVWGEMSLSFDSCNSGEVSWTSSTPGYDNGSLPIERLTSIDSFACATDPIPGNYAITLNDDGERIVGTALLLPSNDAYYVFGDTSIEGIGYGGWRQTTTQNLTIEADSLEISAVNPPPFPKTPFVASVVLTEDGFSALTNPGLAGVRLPSYRRPVDQQALAGTYQLIDQVSAFSFATVALLEDGTLSGTAVNGCALQGSAVLTTPGFNQLEIVIESNDPDDICAGSDLFGAGFVIDPGDPFNGSDLEAYLVNSESDFGSVFILDR